MAQLEHAPKRFRGSIPGLVTCPCFEFNPWWEYAWESTNPCFSLSLPLSLYRYSIKIKICPQMKTKKNSVQQTKSIIEYKYALFWKFAYATTSLYKLPLLVPISLTKRNPALLVWLSWSEHPMHQEVVSSIPDQGTYLGCRLIPSRRCARDSQLTIPSHGGFSLPLTFSLKSIKTYFKKKKSKEDYPF